MADIAKAQGGKKSAKPMKPIPLQAYTIDYAIMASQLRLAGDNDPQFEVAAAAFDADGKLLNSIVNLTAKDDAGVAQGTPVKELYRVEQELDAPMDAKFLRFGVRDTRTGKMGAVEVPLPLAAAN
jgi:hypothetical protein